MLVNISAQLAACCSLKWAGSPFLGHCSWNNNQMFYKRRTELDFCVWHKAAFFSAAPPPPPLKKKYVLAKFYYGMMKS